MYQGFRAIFCDFDGVMIGREERIPEKIKYAVLNWIASGRIFTIIAVHTYETMKQYFRDLKLRSPQIVRGGREIVDPRSGKTIWKSQAIDKGKAVSHMEELMKLLPVETVGIGYSYDDFSVWKYTGLSVATRNAPQKIRKLVDYIIPSYKHDGIAHIIYTLMGLTYRQMELI